MKAALELGDVDEIAWERWLDYRKKIRKALKPVSYEAARKRLATFGEDQAAVVEQSIANGWRGLFALKKEVSRGTNQERSKPRLSAVERVYAATADLIRGVDASCAGVEISGGDVRPAVPVRVRRET